MGAPYVRTAPWNVCTTSERCTESSEKKREEEERQKKTSWVYTHPSAAGTESQLAEVWDLNPKQQVYLLSPAWIEQRAQYRRYPGYRSSGERDNKSNPLQPCYCVYTDDTHKQARNPSSISVPKDRQPDTAGCGPGAYQGTMPTSPSTIRLQGNGASYAKRNMCR